MDVPCPGCGFAASEWAAICPRCGDRLGVDPVAGPPEAAAASGREAGPIPRPEPAAEIETPSPYAPSPATDFRRAPARPQDRRRKALARLSATVVVALAAVGAAVAVGGSRRGQLRPAGGLPASLAAERLIVTVPGYVDEYSAAGLVVGRVAVDGAGASRPVTHGSTVAFVSAGSVFTDDLSRALPPIGRPGLSVFDGPSGSIGVLVARGSGTRIVDYLDVGDRSSRDRAPAPELPAGVTAVAGLASGVLGAVPVVAPTAFVDFEPAVRLAVYTSGLPRELGTVSGVVATSDRMVATVACAGDGTDCHMELLDPLSRRSRRVLIPAGHHAFSSVSGAFSPDGRHLAAFVASSAANGEANVRAVLVDVASGRVRLAGPDLPVAAPAVRAAWSGDGRWLFIQVGDGPIFAQQVRGGRPLGALWPLPLTTSRLLGAV